MNETPNQPPTDETTAASYNEAVAELDQILNDLEDDSLDVDVLAEKVRRASELLVYCRERIRSATDKVEAAVEALGSDQSTSDDEPF